MRFITQIVFICMVLAACNKKQQTPPFTVLDGNSTGLHFSNTLTPTPAFNLFSYMYYYNGAGLAAADFNSDGKTDLCFASNQKGLALFLNQGGLKFTDVTTHTGIVNDSAWNTGVSVIDINNDGLKDLYLCRVGNYKTLKGKNQLWINKGLNAKGIPEFREAAKEAGLDFSGFSTQSAFFDYDGDGDLDMFLLNHSVNHDGNYAPRKLFAGTYDSLAGHRLYRNDGIVNNRLPHFTDVTKQSGINSSKIGYGLGVVVSDINLDGLPDLYIGNDFHENDYLYLNQGNATFKDLAAEALPHTSQFSMGVDAADINNDGFPEIMSMDMLPYDGEMLRRSLSEDDYNIFQHKINYGYTYQYARNNLQYNHGDGRFSDIAPFAGVHATDWSWSALLFDFDNDGYKDFFASNGIPKRMNDIDYISFVSGNEMQQKLKANRITEKDLELIKRFPEIKIPNQFYRNTSTLQFQNISSTINENPSTFSNGAVYADLDNDGDHDVVVNNINDEAIIYQNNTESKKNILSLKLKGKTNNADAVGARIIVFADTARQYYENFVTRGFMSGILTPILLTGLSNNIDSIAVIWPDNSYSLVDTAARKSITLTWKANLPKFDFRILQKTAKNYPADALTDLTTLAGINYLHRENTFNEFDREALLPRMLTSEGPALAVADINGDGLEDFFVGASKGMQAAVFMQQNNGKFLKTLQPALAADSMYEHVDAVWMMADNDKFPDLFIATGGNEYYGEDAHLLPLLYLNNGKGELYRSKIPLPAIYTTQSCVRLLDLNADGRQDVLLTARAVPWAYGKTPSSFLLLNNGNANFTDVTDTYCSELKQGGMITDAVICDMDGDKIDDIVLSLNWGGIDVYYGNKKQFRKQTISGQLLGWWTSLLVTDVNGDKKPDIIAGNLGDNTRLRVKANEPVRMYVNDFDDNGRTEQVITYYANGKEIPYNSKMQLEKQMPVLKKRFLYAADFSKASLEDLLKKEKLEKAKKYTANNFSHHLFISKGNRSFSQKPLPAITQWTETRAMLPLKVLNNSSRIMLAGNFYTNHVETGRQDAGYGTVLTFKSKGENLVAQILSGKLLHGEVRKMAVIKFNGSEAILVASNNDSLRLIKY